MLHKSELANVSRFKIHTESKREFKTKKTKEKKYQCCSSSNSNSNRQKDLMKERNRHLHQPFLIIVRLCYILRAKQELLQPPFELFRYYYYLCFLLCSCFVGKKKNAIHKHPMEIHNFFFFTSLYFISIAFLTLNRFVHSKRSLFFSVFFFDLYSYHFERE